VDFSKRYGTHAQRYMRNNVTSAQVPFHVGNYMQLNTVHARPVQLIMADPADKPGVSC
jgi:hypothetical protein